MFTFTKDYFFKNTSFLVSSYIWKQLVEHNEYMVTQIFLNLEATT